jgi:hypothetical protein
MQRYKFWRQQETVILSLHLIPGLLGTSRPEEGRMTYHLYVVRPRQSTTGNHRG